MSTDKELDDAFTDYYFMVFFKFLGCVTSSERTDIKCLPTIKPHMDRLRLRDIVDVQQELNAANTSIIKTVKDALYTPKKNITDIQWQTTCKLCFKESKEPKFKNADRNLEFGFFVFDKERGHGKITAYDPRVNNRMASENPTDCLDVAQGCGRSRKRNYPDYLDQMLDDDGRLEQEPIALLRSLLHTFKSMVSARKLTDEEEIAREFRRVMERTDFPLSVARYICCNNHRLY